jgi:hypothetical protein
MSANWIRHFELILTDKNGSGISLSDFKVTFSIDWYRITWPRVATVRIYNLGLATTNRILSSEFTKIKLIAGYDGLTPVVDSSQLYHPQGIDPSQIGQTAGQNWGEIYSGEIRFTLTGRENPTDTYVVIQAVDGNNAWNNATINQTIAAGHTVQDIHTQALQNLAPYGIKQGITPTMPTTVYPRGRTMYGSTRDVLHNISAQCDATWQFVGGKVDMVPDNNYIQQAIVLNSSTGLISMPQQTMGGGVNVKCLINPNIRISGLIQLDQASIIRAELSKTDIQQVPENNQPIRYATGSDGNGNVIVGTPAQGGSGNLLPPLSQPASIATDGVYMVQGISYTGDTRGQPWYMELMCAARGSADLMNQSAMDRNMTGQ